MKEAHLDFVIRKIEKTFVQANLILIFKYFCLLI